MSLIKIQQQQNEVLSFKSNESLEEDISGFHVIDIGYRVLKRLGYLIVFHRNLDMYNQGRVTHTLMRRGILTRQFESECGKNAKCGIMVEMPRPKLGIRLYLRQKSRRTHGDIDSTRFVYDIAYVVLKRRGKIIDMVCGDMFGIGSTFRTSLTETYTINEIKQPKEWVCSFHRDY